MNSYVGIPPADSAGERPVMELIDGISSVSPPMSSTERLIRFSVYSVILTIAAALLGVIVIPETSALLPFIPDPSLPQLDSDFLAELIAIQEAYLQRCCLTSRPLSPSGGESAANAGHTVMRAGGESPLGLAASGPGSEPATVPNNVLEDADPARFNSVEGDSSLAD